VDSAFVRLALDTGATRTLINESIIRVVGYPAKDMSETVQITTGSGIESTPLIVLSRIAALGLQRRNLSIICHNLPPTASVDGLLGLDFLRNRNLSINFRSGRISLK
jgi:aspartyl protease family protein